MLLFGRNQHNTVKQLSFNKNKLIFKKIKENEIEKQKVKMCLKAGIVWQWGLFPTAGTFMLFMGIILTVPLYF